METFIFVTPQKIGEVPFIEIDEDWGIKSSSDEEDDIDNTENEEEQEGYNRTWSTRPQAGDRWRSAANRLRRNKLKRQQVRGKRLPGKVKFFQPNHQTPVNKHIFAAEYEMQHRVCSWHCLE